jgi:hypothetical protein
MPEKIEIKFRKEKKFERRFLETIKREIIKLKEETSPHEFDKKYKELRERFIKENPEEAITIETLFGLKDLVEADMELNALRQKKEKIEPEKLKQLLRDLTEWQFTTTYFLIHAGRDRKFASTFWSECSDLYKLFSGQKIQRYRKGIIGQVGVYRLMERLGLKPKLSHPDEDAFEQADLWISYPKSSEAISVQTKYTVRAQKPVLMSTDEISYPSILRYEEKKDIYISQKDMHEMLHLKEKCQSKAKRSGKNVVALYLACPDGSFDGLTGEPKPEFLAKIEPEIKKYFSQSEKP